MAAQANPMQDLATAIATAIREALGGRGGVKMPNIQRFNGKEEDPVQRIHLLLQICDRKCVAHGVTEDLAKVTLFCDSFLEGDPLVMISDLIYHDWACQQPG